MGAAAAVTAGKRVFASANDTVRIAIVGCGGRGGSHLREWTTLPNVELVAISDVDQSHMANFVKRVESSGKKAPQGFQDMRKLLEDKSIDAISIATPNHWHTLHDHLGLPGGQGRVRGEAVLPQHVRGQADCGRGAQIQPHGAAGQPDPLFGSGAGSHSEDARRA